MLDSDCDEVHQRREGEGLMPKLEPMKIRMDRMKSLYLQGYDLAYISEKMGITPGYIEDCLKKMKVWEDYGGIEGARTAESRLAYGRDPVRAGAEVYSQASHRGGE